MKTHYGDLVGKILENEDHACFSNIKEYTKMRQFIYLNSDIVNSIIAQKGRGLIDAITTENAAGKEKSKDRSWLTDISGNAGANFLKIAKAEASLNLEGKISSTSASQNTTKEIVAKTLHDAAYDIAYEVIEPKEVSYGEDRADPGEYIEMKRVFDFIDFEYLENLFARDGIVDYIKKQEKDTIQTEAEKHINNSFNREQKRNSGGKASLSKTIEELKNQIDKKYNNMQDIIFAIGKIVPYERMLFSGDGYLVPMEESFFRVNPNSLGFMYGGEIRCVGMITNVIGKDTNPNDDSNIFATIQYSINEVIREILPTDRDNLYVVTPIAVYYEE